MSQPDQTLNLLVQLGVLAHADVQAANDLLDETGKANGGISQSVPEGAEAWSNYIKSLSEISEEFKNVGMNQDKPATSAVAEGGMKQKEVQSSQDTGAGNAAEMHTDHEEPRNKPAPIDEAENELPAARTQTAGVESSDRPTRNLDSTDQFEEAKKQIAENAKAGRELAVAAAAGSREHSASLRDIQQSLQDMQRANRQLQDQLKNSRNTHDNG
jgi:hypothetical protein